jgi:hypothetical protein
MAIASRSDRRGERVWKALLGAMMSFNGRA